MLLQLPDTKEAATPFDLAQNPRAHTEDIAIVLPRDNTEQEVKLQVALRMDETEILTCIWTAFNAFPKQFQRLLQNNLDEVKRTLEEHAEELKRSRGKDEVPRESSLEVQCDNKNTLRTGSRVVTPPVDGLGLPTGTTVEPPPVEGPPLPTGTKVVNAN